MIRFKKDVQDSISAFKGTALLISTPDSVPFHVGGDGRSQSNIAERAAGPTPGTSTEVPPSASMSADRYNHETSASRTYVLCLHWRLIASTQLLMDVFPYPFAVDHDATFNSTGDLRHGIWGHVHFEEAPRSDQIRALNRIRSKLACCSGRLKRLDDAHSVGGGHVLQLREPTGWTAKNPFLARFCTAFSGLDAGCSRGLNLAVIAGTRNRKHRQL